MTIRKLLDSKIFKCIFLAGSVALGAVTLGATIYGIGLYLGYFHMPVTEGAESHSHVVVPPAESWSWQSLTGTFDRASAQRGYQIYKEVCAACHSLKRVAYRNLTELGFTEAEVKAIAAQNMMIDGPNDEGEMFERQARPSDRFVSPYKNDQEARASNGGALPPDLSLIVKARFHGPDYLYALLTGYENAPEGFKLSEGSYYNKWFPGHQIAMPAPLQEGLVTYADGTQASVGQMARDVTTFLAWASEPYKEEQKRKGIKVMIFLVIFAGILYLVKRKVWRKLH